MKRTENKKDTIEKKKKINANNVSQYQIQDSFCINNIDAATALYHPIKSRIMEILVKKEASVYDITKETSLNPGTVKRHMEDLLKNDLIVLSREILNPYNMIVKLYRSAAKSFEIRLRWP